MSAIPQETSLHQITTPDGTLRIALMQTNFWVGDIAGNVRKMRALTQDAKVRGADIVIFPELSLIGSPPEDLLLRPTLAERIKEGLADLAQIHDIVIILGYPHVDTHGTFNSVAILQNGTQKGFYHKQCLANYGVSDERRYFKEGRNHVLFDLKGTTIGLLIGEDLWQDTPIKALKEQGAELIISLHASPFEIGKQNVRRNLLAHQAQKYTLPIVYINTAGAQDDIVFDGGSLIVQKDGTIAHEGSRFVNQLIMADFEVATGQFDQQQKAPLDLSEESEMYQALVVGLRDYVNRSGFKGVILGLSGGIDSALSLCIAVDALGADKVYAVMMPYEYTSAMSLEDAAAQAGRLNISYTICPIHDAVSGLSSALAPLLAGSTPDTTEENLQARSRGMILMALSNKFGHMVISTGNKSENAVGYSTLYGDMVGGFNVLKDVYKTDVYRLAHYRNRLEDTPVIPERVINRPPSAELKPDQTDQDSLPDYAVLDAILRLYIDEDVGYKGICAKGFDPVLVEKVLSMTDKAEHKRRQGAIGTKITQKSFGRDRRYPLVNGWAIKGYEL
ncbi:MAG: NAD+ synthase [Moraxella sp.]|nr:NAD+ synthase [Moraxella sp.]